MPIRNLLFSLRSDGLKGRALRGSAWTFLAFGWQNLARLLSNLVLTRLLFPEDFGLMALVVVVLTGLEMMSDAGVNLSIMQHGRGEDTAFLNTAWTIQILRGLVIWLFTAAFADPIARFYDQPMLAALLPVAGLNALLLGLQSTNMARANRNLVLGRLTALELGTQLLGILVMILLAWWTQSIWALLIGWLVSSAARSALSHVVLPGPRNRFGWDRAAFIDLFNFGKYIFISSTAGFLIGNADRAVLGKFISIGELGIYNIGYFLATVPLVLSNQFTQRILMPLYIKAPPWEGNGNPGKIRRARALLGIGLLGMTAFLAVIGDGLVDVLYEPEYALAGPVVVLMALAWMPFLFMNNYGRLLLAAGESRTFTIMQVTIAVVQTLVLYLGVKTYGLMGAIAAPVIAAVTVYPLVALFAARRNGWDPALDCALALLAVLIGVVALWINDTALAEILATRPR